MRFEAPESKDQYEYLGETDMPSRQIEEFAKILVREVRDAAIRDGDIARRPECQATTAKRWRRLGAAEADPLVAAVIQDCVDDTLYFLLDAIDQGTLKLQFITADGEVVDLNREGLGELAGWYAGGAEGWTGMYSKERFSEEEGTEGEATLREGK